jgi:peptide-methionine (S)-S-oxide reductase
VGYAGGLMEAPNYGKIGDHTETVQVDYDPDLISYARLLDVFWESHRPTDKSWSQQYKNAIFYHDEHQRKIAAASKMAVEQEIGRPVKTDVSPIRAFTMAEDYHQKYLLKHHGELKTEMSRIYPRHGDFVNSTAVARLNGYAGHNGSTDQLSREIESLGLSAAGEKALGELVRR